MNGTQESRKSESAQSASQPILTSRAKLTQELAKDLFDYREDGVLLWKINKRHTNVGDEAGRLSSHRYPRTEYLRIKIAGRSYGAHRIVWLWHHGYLPEHEIDHINRVSTDNRIENLREVTRTCNLRNTGNHSQNTSGVKGVNYHKGHGKWEAKIQADRKIIHVGEHDSFLEAVCHRLAVEQALEWEGCDSSSPAFKYVQQHISKI